MASSISILILRVLSRARVFLAYLLMPLWRVGEMHTRALGGLDCVIRSGWSTTPLNWAAGKSSGSRSSQCRRQLWVMNTLLCRVQCMPGSDGHSACPVSLCFCLPVCRPGMGEWETGLLEDLSGVSWLFPRTWSCSLFLGSG